MSGTAVDRLLNIIEDYRAENKNLTERVQCLIEIKITNQDQKDTDKNIAILDLCQKCRNIQNVCVDMEIRTMGGCITRCSKYNPATQEDM